MNVNDHADAGDDETALKKKRLEKVEDAIAHTERTLVDLKDVRDALQAELKEGGQMKRPERSEIWKHKKTGRVAVVLSAGYGQRVSYRYRTVGASRGNGRNRAHVAQTYMDEDQFTKAFEQVREGTK